MKSFSRLDQLTSGGCATLACLMEVAAPKPGNVHRGADFDDTSFYDFQSSAVVLGQTIDQNPESGLGQLIYSCVQGNLELVGKNTNLGMILLICPLALSKSDRRLERKTVVTLLNSLTPEDCRWVYQAIASASPGGLGESEQADVAGDAPNDLIEAMRLAEDRDLVARQYSCGFETVFDTVVPWLRESLTRDRTPIAIVKTHVRLMALNPDSLIGRKCGGEVAKHSQLLAQKAVDVMSNEELFWERTQELDYWLRSDGNRRNPGTTADLIAAGLYVLIARGELDDHSTSKEAI